VEKKEKEIVSEKAYQVAFDFEKNNHGCAQATISAITEIFDVNPIVFKTASPCSGGISNGGIGPCGAFIGGALIFGYFFGRDLNNKNVSGRKYKDRDLTNVLRKKFHSEYYGETCRDVQKAVFGHSFDLLTEEGKRNFEIEGGHICKCPDTVGKAVQWIVEILIGEAVPLKERGK